MRLGKVVGTIVATQKDRKLVGAKLLLVREMELDGTLTNTYVVTMDTVGAGIGEIVMTVAGSSARLTAKTTEAPVDNAVVAIVDTVEVEGKIVFRKE